MKLTEYLNESARVMADSGQACAADLEVAIAVIADAVKSQRAVLICGNGGSMSSAQHFAGELVCKLGKPRAAINAVALASNPAVLSAWANDVAYDDIFAREVDALKATAGVLIGLTTSGKSRNVIAAVKFAKKHGIKTIALMGESGPIVDDVDVAVRVPSLDTQRVQEVHDALLHYIAMRFEEA